MTGKISFARKIFSLTSKVVVVYVPAATFIFGNGIDNTSAVPLDTKKNGSAIFF